MAFDKPVRVVFPIRQASWTGGENYLKIIKVAADQLEREGVVEVVEPFCKVLKLLNKFPATDKAQKVYELIRGRKHLNFPWPLTKFASNSMYWIPDCQDLEEPHYFTQEELMVRAKRRNQAMVSDRAVYFSSQTALEVFMKFYGTQARIAGIIRFAMPVVESEIGDKPMLRHECATCLINGFFYLPNQWWKHKNHEFALEAYKDYRAMGGKSHLILTGKQDDYRWPEYAREILCKIDATEGVHNLGFVSPADQSTLYLSARATIQPSLYEGWSTTIEESLYFGTPIICSELELIKEQTKDCEGVALFDPKDRAQLVKNLLSPPPEVGENALIERRNLRWNRFISDFTNTVTNGTKTLNKSKHKFQYANIFYLNNKT